MNRTSRRNFIRGLALTTGAAALGNPFTVSGQKPARKMGIALVGLGSYSNGQLAPALQQTTDCYLAGIVTGTPSKAKTWSEKYSIPQKNIYNYENFDTIADNPDIDIVYVVLPISMHKEFTIRAAKAGKHVICEKPMAMNASECREMIDACKKAGRQLSIGYRLHFEPYNMEMMRLGQQQVYGKVNLVSAENGFYYGGDPSAWRLKKDMAGGGGLMDMGVYAVQGARYVLGEEPIYVTAREEKTRPELFREVDETVFWELEFPGGARSKGMSSYNKNISRLHAQASKGWFELSPAYGYGGQQGRTHLGPMKFPHINQQARQMDDFAKCIRNGSSSKVPGEMGLNDMLVIDAIYRSLKSGKREAILKA